MVRGETRKTLTLHSRLRGKILTVFGFEDEASTFLMLLGEFGGKSASVP